MRGDVSYCSWKDMRALMHYLRILDGCKLDVWDISAFD